METPSDTGVRPSARQILQALADAGEGGVITPDIAGRFTYPAGWSRRLNWINTELRRLRLAGRAVRSETTESSPATTTRRHGGGSSLPPTGAAWLT